MKCGNAQTQFWALAVLKNDLMTRREGLSRCDGMHCGVKHSDDSLCPTKEKRKMLAVFNCAVNPLIDLGWGKLQISGDCDRTT